MSVVGSSQNPVVSVFFSAAPLPFPSRYWSWHLKWPQETFLASRHKKRLTKSVFFERSNSCFVDLRSFFWGGNLIYCQLVFHWRDSYYRNVAETVPFQTQTDWERKTVTNTSELRLWTESLSQMMMSRKETKRRSNKQIQHLIYTFQTSMRQLRTIILRKHCLSVTVEGKGWHKVGPKNKLQVGWNNPYK